VPDYRFSVAIGLLGFCLVNLSVRGMGVVAIGIACNALVIGLNLGMPTKAFHGGRVDTTVTQQPAEHSDLLRYEILRRHGGVYVDTDVECLRPIDELLTGVVAFAGFELPGRLGTAVMGAVPGHAAMEELTLLASVACGHGPYPASTGPALANMVLPEYDDITLFSADRFYPVLWDGVERRGAEAPYADHHWTLSWQSD